MRKRSKWYILVLVGLTVVLLMSALACNAEKGKLSDTCTQAYAGSRTWFQTADNSGTDGIRPDCSLGLQK